ncbi:DoxX family protein [Corynebacterium gerontici]|uniref:Uncharacterized protein n=1 Tax=Corynebacterium gerontici TaxID=2079234 RepID=A0A3G6J6K5_9CORY|nr:hypothetical protein [Corynebacterium gerontici]AZA11644.1 hypothetical protein CGERO_06720 [Corynebacterium gerontici]
MKSHVLQSSAFAAMSALHFLKPEPFDAIIPPFMPGDRRTWTYASGVAEGVVAALIANPETRKLGGRSAVALLLAVWPANFEMARQALQGDGKKRQIISVLRLPLQLPLMMAAAKLGK